MAMSEADASHGDWLLYHQLGLSGQPSGMGGGTGTMFGRASPLAESTVVTTTLTAASSVGSTGGAGAQPATDGRGGKASRRRPRASRKGPTTILNADASNFRAMVQHYTGAPSCPSLHAGYPEASAAGGGVGVPTGLSFGLGGGVAQLRPQPPARFHVGVQQQQPRQYQQHHERPLFPLGGEGGDGPGDGVVSLHGLFGGGNQQRRNGEESVGYLMESISSLQRSAPSTGGGATGGFLL